MTFRNLATALSLSLLLATPAFAADETVPNLSAAAPAAGTDLVPTTQGGSLLKQTLSAILTYIEGAFQKASAAQFGVVEVDNTTILASGGVISVGTISAASIASGALANGMTATTQSTSDNSTKLATTAYVQANSVQSVGTGNGLTGGPITGTGTIAPTFYQVEVTSSCAVLTTSSGCTGNSGGDMAYGVMLGGSGATLTLSAKATGLWQPGQTFAVTVDPAATGNWTLTNSSTLTLRGLNNTTTLYPGEAITFVADADGSHLDAVPGIQPPTTAALGGVLAHDCTGTGAVGSLNTNGGSTCVSVSGSSGANPSATAGPSAVNGSATTFMRSDAAPAVQKASSSQFGIVEVDGSTITATGGVISAVGGGGSTVIYNSIGGCVESNDGTAPSSVLDMAACQAADSTNAVEISASAFTKSTAGAWASGSGSNGMGNGLTIAASTWYHVCLANNGGTADYWFDTSVSCANRPSGITDTKYRRIGSFLTDSSSHIVAFVQTNDTFTWKVQANNINSGSLPASVTTQAVAVPPGVKTRADLNFYTGVPSTFVASFILVYDPDSSATNTGGNLNCSSSTTGAADAPGTCQLQVTTNASQQVDILPNSAVTGAYLNTIGYRDFRGQ